MRQPSWTNPTQFLTDRIVDRSIEPVESTLPCKLRTRALEPRTFDPNTRHVRTIMCAWTNAKRSIHTRALRLEAWDEFPFEKRTWSRFFA